MLDWVVIGLAGFVASFVDGALGMGFGPTSSTILLGAGLSPGAVSATVNLAKVVTGFGAAVAHWRFENIDHRLVVRLALPGAAGAVVGATVLATVDGRHLRPVLAVFLLLVGLRILVRFGRGTQSGAVGGDGEARLPAVRGVEAVAAAGGVTNGVVGTWGPVVTPFLLHRGVPPRFAVGSVNTAEVAVAVMSVGSLLGSRAARGVDAATVIAMLAGGLIASPVAAVAVRRIAAAHLGLAVAALLMITNLRELAGWWQLGPVRWWLYAGVLLVVTAAAIGRRRATRSAPDGEPAVAATG